MDFCWVKYESVNKAVIDQFDSGSHAFNIFIAEKPEEYMGKTVKMTGAFASMYSEEQGKMLYACLIQDATACCSQALEFEPTEEPDDSLEQGSEITVVGVLDSYEEDETIYCTLKNAIIL